MSAVAHRLVNAANLFASSSMPVGNANQILTVSEVEFTPNLWLDSPGFLYNSHDQDFGVLAISATATRGLL